ncbi:MAG: hypothetical protein [Siphoviridae sp. ctdEk19]|nr:MAG: hypothetical protein [Siphoviridae sp. ctdEk19]
MARVVSAPAVRADLPGYESPATGRWVEGRRERVEDLRRSGCVEYDPEMKKDASRIRAADEAKAEARLDDAVMQTAGQLGLL